MNPKLEFALWVSAASAASIWIAPYVLAAWLVLR